MFELGKTYEIKLGRYSDTYVCTGKPFVDFLPFTLQRTKMPVTKIDAIRLPEYIHIKEVKK